MATSCRASAMRGTACSGPSEMLIRNATLTDGRSGIDVLVQAGRFAAIGTNLSAP